MVSLPIYLYSMEIDGKIVDMGYGYGMDNEESSYMGPERPDSTRAKKSSKLDGQQPDHQLNF
ncbi:15328_t:CDS:2 [Entrophospora sp. SA101]|nr:15328_t:CDS:2 [Entrophospora sp. SA101]